METCLKGSPDSHNDVLLTQPQVLVLDICRLVSVPSAGPGQTGTLFYKHFLDGGVWFPGPFLLINLWASSTLLVFLS